MSLSLFQYVLTAAIRDRLVISLITILILGASLAIFLGSAASTEKDQFALVYTGGGLRMMGVLGLVLFVVFFIRRAFESKDVDFLLSRPIGRIEFLISFAAAFSFLALLMSFAQGLCLYAVAPNLFSTGHWLWIVSILVENIIMVNIALFFAMLLSSAATAAMVTVAFYVLARMMGQVLGILDASSGSGAFNEILAMAMQMISAVTPRLDLMGQTSWLVYGLDDGVGFAYILIQGSVFCFLVFCAALVDMVKRQF